MSIAVIQAPPSFKATVVEPGHFVAVLQQPEPIVARVAGLVPGPQGISAYQVALDNGFVGTEAEWLESLRGQDGASSINYTRWHTYEPPYSYCAKAELGSAPEDPVWTIHRIEVTIDGTTTTTTATAVTRTDYQTHNYS